MRNNQKGIVHLFLLIVLALVVIGGIGYYAYKNRQIKLPSQTSPTISTPTPDPTANWILFSSDYEYSLKFPPSYKAGATGFNKTAEKSTSIRIYSENVQEPLKQPHINIVVIVAPKLELKSQAELNYNTNVNHKGISATLIEPVKENTFLGMKSYEYSLSSLGFISPTEEYLGYEGIYKVIWVEKSDNQYMIAYTKNDEFDQILSTFKFLDK